MLKVATEEDKSLLERETPGDLPLRGVYWVDLERPSEAELQAAGAMTAAPAELLARAADARSGVHAEAREGWLLLTSKALDSSGRRPHAQHLGLLVAGKGLISIHEVPLAEAGEVCQVWRLEGVADGTQLLYWLLDAALDRLFPVLDELEEELYRVEEGIIRARLRQDTLRHILRMSRRLLIIRKVAGALRETANCLLRHTSQQQYWSGFQQLYDHATRAVDIAEMVHEMASNCIDAHLASVSNQLNGVMKTLTIWATVLMSMSFIAGVFGMNFAFPHLVKDQSLRGFWASVGAMGVTALGLLWWFRRRGYLGG